MRPSGAPESAAHGLTTGGGSMLGTPKNGKARNIAIPRFLMPQIKAQMDGMGDDDWLFRATRGGNVLDEHVADKDMEQGRQSRPAWRTRA